MGLQAKFMDGKEIKGADSVGERAGRGVCVGARTSRQRVPSVTFRAGQDRTSGDERK